MKFFSKTKFAAQEAEPTAAPNAGRGRGYTVGWLPQLERTSVIWDAPKPFRQDSAKNPIAKSVTQCPAVLDFDRRFFVINSPIDLHLRLSVIDGELGITNLLYDKSPVRESALQQMIHVPAAGRMAASEPPRHADADDLRLRFRRSRFSSINIRRSSTTLRRSGRAFKSTAASRSISGRAPCSGASNGTTCRRT